jgi:hypothetical protein
MPRIHVLVDPKPFKRDMQNLIDYTLGTLEGVQKGKYQYMQKMGVKVAAILEEYMDSVAKMEPDTMHHVYEWDKVGQKTARLFKIVPTYTKEGMTFSSIFTQSKSLQKSRGSKIPFRDKAFIMENGIRVDIYPRGELLLRYYDEKVGWTTSYHSRVENPGGTEVVGRFGSNFRTFFATYLSQSKLLETGMLVKPFSKAYAKNYRGQALQKGKVRSGGRLKGIETGYKWMIGAADVVEVE